MIIITEVNNERFKEILEAERNLMELSMSNDEPKRKALIISSENRANFHHNPSIIAFAMDKIGFDVSLYRRDFYTNKVEYLKLPKRLNEFDIIIASNSDNNVLDFNNINKETERIFLYYENYDIPKVPKGTSEIWTNEALLNDLLKANFLELNDYPIFKDFCKPLVVPELPCWTPKPKDIIFAYNGSLRLGSPVFENLHMYMKRDFCLEIKLKVPKFKIPIPDPNLEQWLDEFARTDINLHISQSGTGQGFYEGALLECIIIEQVFEGLGKPDPRLKDGKNCFIVQSPREAILAFHRALKMDRTERDKMITEAKKLIDEHSWKSLLPSLISKFYP